MKEYLQRKTYNERRLIMADVPVATTAAAVNSLYRGKTAHKYTSPGAGLGGASLRRALSWKGPLI